MNSRLKGRVAIVTGGGHGIGRAYARRLAEEGASVVIAEIDIKAATSAAEELEKEGFEALAVHTDVTKPDSVKEMARLTAEKFGRIDILVNNAAIFISVPMSRAPFDEIDPDEWDRMMAVNVKGAWLSSCAVAPYMRDQQYGKIINISSGTALKGADNRIHYVASKAAILGFTKTLANELGKEGVCVNCIAPGSTMSEENPDDAIRQRRASAASTRAIPRLQMPEDMLGAVVFFSSSDSDFITGQTLVVDGGSCMH